MARERSDENNSSSTPGSTTSNSVSSADLQAFVLETVVASGEDGSDPEIVAVAVHDVYPGLSMDAYAIEADGSNTSIMSTTLIEKGDDGPDNPLIVAVATRQVAGECIGSAVYGYPLPTERFEVTDLAACTAQAVVDALALQIG